MGFTNNFFYILGEKILKKSTSFNLNNFSIFIVFLFFLSQLITGLVVLDLYLYLKDLHNLFFAFLIYIEAFFILKMNKNNLSRISNYMIFTGTILIILDFIYFLTGQSFLNLIKSVLDKESFPVYQVNLDRGRFNLYLYTEIFFPFLLFSYLKKNKLNKIIQLFL